MTETEDYDKSATPTGHHVTHENAGDDEISVEELSGELAGEQKSAWSKVSGKPATFPPEGHHASHEDGDDDEMDVTGLAGTTPRAVLGDSTAGRVIRRVWLEIEDGTDANTIAIELVGRWNGDSVARVDNIAKGDSGTYFELSANGENLWLKPSCFSGDVVSCLAGTIHRSSLSTAITIRVRQVSLGIYITICNASTGANLDMSTIPTGKYCYATLVYITTA